MDFLTLKKTELHCHLDGSLPKEWMEETLNHELAQDQISVPDDCKSLTEYLEKFDIPVSCMQEEVKLEGSAYAFAKKVASENVTHMEVRFAPSLHTSKGMSYSQIIRAVNRGMKRAEEETSMKYGIIVCAMRHQPLDMGLQMLEEAVLLRDQGVVALDLAGDESAFPSSLFEELFRRARELNMPFTIHSGETGSLENVRIAYEYGAKRIGHGIALKKDPGLMRAYAEAGIGVEMCPSSNFQTKAITGWDEYPLPEFLEAGVVATINTDNRTVSNTCLSKELELVYQQYGNDRGMLETLLKNAENVTF